MSNSFTQVFGGTTIYPADVSYLALTLDGNISLEWPLEATAGSSVVARIIDITPSGPYTITMPDAMSVSVGQTVLFNNLGPSTVAVNKANGSAILSIGAGEQWQAYLIDNATVGGTWRTLRYGAATAQAQAAALAGPGLTTSGSALAQNYEVIDFTITPYISSAADRAKVFVWTGGLGTLNLPSVASAGDGWFIQVRNSGQGDLTIDPSGSELINAGSTLRLQPGDSAVIVGDGVQWYTIGLGQQAVFAFDYTSVAVTGGTYTLSGSELNRIAYKFTGTLTSNVTIVVPATVQQYWVNNATTGAFTLSLRAAGSGTSTPITQASTAILYCDGTTIVPATTSVTFAGILPVLQGGTGANNPASARTNLGASTIGSDLFTALTTASARNTILAASSGANSDITSLTGLTTPLSVGQGGTGTATAFTPGSVVFSGASGVYSQDNANFFWDDTNNRLGIGTTSPLTRLHVSGGGGVLVSGGGASGYNYAQFSNDVGNGVAIGVGGSTASGWTQNLASVFNASNNPLAFGTNNLERMRITAAGNVGVGTASPTYKFEARTDAASGFNWVASNNNTATGSFGAGFLATTGAGSSYLYMRGDGITYVENSSNNPLAFATNALERMRITAAGDVGIGATAPAERFQVNVNTGINGLEKGISLTNTVDANLFNYVTGTATTDKRAFITAGAANQSLTFGTLYTERMRITAAGDVGIGTIAPSGYGKLAVIGGNLGVSQDSTTVTTIRGNANVSNIGAFNSTGASLTFSTAPSGSGEVERMRITSAGNVGIGTIAPNAKLEAVGGSTQNKIRVSGSTFTDTVADVVIGRSGTNSAGLAQAPALEFSNTTDASGVILQGSNQFQIFTNNAGAGWLERMRINASGDVGIGTATPQSKLHVSGGYVTAGNVSSTAGSRIIGGDYSGAEHITTFGSEFSSGGPVIGYGVWPSTASALAFVSSAAPALQRAAYTQTGNNHVWFTGASQTVAVGSAVTMTERMRLDGSGNLGLGTAPSGARLDVNGNIRSTLGSGGTLSLFETDATRANQLFCGADASGSFINATFSTGGTATLRLQTANNEHMRINGAGDVGIGTVSPASRFNVAGTAAINWVAGGTSSGLVTLGTQGASGGSLFVNTASVGATFASGLGVDGSYTNPGGVGTSLVNIKAYGVNSGGGYDSALVFHTSLGTSLTEKFRITSTGGITSSNLADAVGYKGLPQNSQTASYTLALSDMGKHISITTGGVVIPANGAVAFPIGSAVTIFNNSGSNQTISITTDTLRQAGTANTGSRTLAQYGVATVLKVTSTVWVISGAGVS